MPPRNGSNPARTGRQEMVRAGRAEIFALPALPLLHITNPNHPLLAAYEYGSEHA
jgi:hypothetical protein